MKEVRASWSCDRLRGMEIFYNVQLAFLHVALEDRQTVYFLEQSAKLPLPPKGGPHRLLAIEATVKDSGGDAAHVPVPTHEYLSPHS